MKSLHCFCARYSSLFKFDKNNLEDSYIDAVKYANQYFNIIEVEPLEIWTKLKHLKSKEESYSSIFLLVELCLCAPYSTAQLEQFFNHMKYVKSDLCSSSTQLNLSSLLKKKMLPGEISVSYFNSQLSICCVKLWYNRKDRCILQKRWKVKNLFDESSEKVWQLSISLSGSEMDNEWRHCIVHLIVLLL